jgi:hypothetical protein
MMERVWFANTPPSMEPLMILPWTWILRGSMLRVLVTQAIRRHPDIRPADRLF